MLVIGWVKLLVCLVWLNYVSWWCNDVILLIINKVGEIMLWCEIKLVSLFNCFVIICCFLCVLFLIMVMGVFVLWLCFNNCVWICGDLIIFI